MLRAAQKLLIVYVDLALKVVESRSHVYIFCADWMSRRARTPAFTRYARKGSLELIVLRASRNEYETTCSFCSCGKKMENTQSNTFELRNYWRLLV